MIRFLFNLFLVCAVAIAISMQDGVMHVQRGNMAIDLDLQTALALLVLAFVWWWGIAKIWFFIKYGFSRRHEKQKRRRTEEGWKSLTQAINALASGDVRAAQKQLRCARKLLGDAPLALWVEAELANRRGDAKSASALYQQLAAMPEGAVLGWRGLLQQSPRQNSADVLRLTRDALTVSAIAKQDFAHELRIMAFAQQADWGEALLALHVAQKAKAIVKPRALLLEAVLMAKHGETLAVHDTEAALKHVRNAYKLQPAHVPLALAYAGMLAQQGDTTLANKVLAVLWLVQPHLDALALYQSINSKSDALANVQAFEKFALKRKDHAATHIGLAQLCLAANVTGMAHTHAERAVAITPCREAYVVLADVQRAEGVDATAQRSAIAAPPLGMYRCDACGHTAAIWGPTCVACNKVATLQWQEDIKSMRVFTEPKMLIS